MTEQLEYMISNCGKRTHFVIGSIFIWSLILLTPEAGHSHGLIQSIWSCSVPCATQGKPEDLLGSIQVSYCSTSVLSPSMIKSLDPVCQAKTKRADAIAIRTSPAAMATCESSANPCPKEGLTRSGFTCNYVCPSEDKKVRHFTACASTSDEAWSYATQLCKDATAPGAEIFPSAKLCTPEGQTPCE